MHFSIRFRFTVTDDALEFVQTLITDNAAHHVAEEIDSFGPEGFATKEVFSGADNELNERANDIAHIHYANSRFILHTLKQHDGAWRIEENQHTPLNNITWCPLHLLLNISSRPDGRFLKAYVTEYPLTPEQLTAVPGVIFHPIS